MQTLKKVAAASAAVLTLLTGALTASAGPASAAEYHPNIWSGSCVYGSACVFPTNAPNVWNVDRCFDNWMTPQSFYYAQAHGNPFTVYYQDGRSDYVQAWSSRPLDTRNLVTKIVVWC